MHCELLLRSDMTQDSCAKYFYEILKDRVKIESDYKEYNGRHNNGDSYDYTYVSCKYVSFDFDKDEEELKPNFRVVNEVYNFKANISSEIMVFNSTFYDGLNILFRLIKFVMDDLDDDLLFVENGDKVVLERRNKTLYTYVQEGEQPHYPFELLERKVNVVHGMQSYYKIYNLLISGDATREFCIKYIYTLLKDELKIDTDCNEHEDQINLLCDYLSLDFRHPEYVSDRAKKDFNFNGSAEVEILVFTRIFDKGIELLFSIIKSVMNNFEGDLLLLENSPSKIILQRRNGISSTYTQTDDEFKYPFEMFGREVKTIK